jgi:hypothetical protein
MTNTTVAAPFFARGSLVEGNDTVQKSRDLNVEFATPELNLNALIHPRSEPPPLLNVPTSDIIDFLVEGGKWIADSRNPHMSACFERMASTHILPRSVIEAVSQHAVLYLNRDILQRELEQSFPDPEVLDRWVPKTDFTGKTSFVRAFGPRLIHILPGNSPGVAIKSIAQGALVKAVNLFKMSSADPFTMVALLQSFADIDPNHPLVKSMSAVYWRGGDDTTERSLFRPQYFDKLVAWGGGEAINNLVKYMGPGFQLVSFDPKSSISMLGREVFESEASVLEAAQSACNDIMMLNQEACAASRFQFIEGNKDDVNRFSEQLQKLIAERAIQSGDLRPIEAGMRDEIEALMLMDDDYTVFGDLDGKGIVIHSDEPVDFHPINKTANVVRVESLDDAVQYVTVATQTVGFYPDTRIADYRDRLASAGAQRVTRLGEAGGSTIGTPWDGMYPLHRFVQWVTHEDGFTQTQ